MTAPETDETILVADDDEEIREVIRFKLQSEASVVTAADGHECWEYLQSHREDPPSVLVLDVMMPRMNGRQVLERVRDDEAFDAMAVVVLTSIGRSDQVVEALETGATDYMNKPFSPDELLARIRRARG
ncbi:response regulator [Halomarina oriensis]|uniref:Response regulator n=1 Tax=Halomarina oriensis TaxID=671145 RepID=A0A6B0GQP0_9EURY|nr:response regulator [Halomarina oriensis]